MKFIGKNNESIEVISINSNNYELLNNSRASELSLLWFKSAQNIINIDTVDYTVGKNELISFTEFNNLMAKQIESAVLIRWNRAFYCVLDHDSEVNCLGILYYGASNIPVIKPNNKDVDILGVVYKMLLIEMESKDNLQLEMLQIMLKRLIILCTRIYRNQKLSKISSDKKTDIIRKYNFLVEQHFKTKRSVKEYAELLHKSPKTLSNLFKKSGNITPLQCIHNRIILEAIRLLSYTSLSISEISYQLGFSDIQTFSSFFKKRKGVSPQKFREGNITNIIGKIS